MEVGRGTRRSGGVRATVLLLVAAALAVTGCTSAVAGRATAAGGPQPEAPSATGRTDPTAAPARPSRSPSPGSGAPTGRGDPFDDAQGRFTLVPPAGWRVDTSGAQNTAALFTDPQPLPSSRVAPSIAINVAPWPRDLEAARQQGETQLTAQGVDVVSVDPVALADGTPAYRFDALGPHPQEPGVELQNLQLFTVRDGSIYVLTGTTETKDWARYRDVLEASAATFALAA